MLFAEAGTIKCGGMKTWIDFLVYILQLVERGEISCIG
jgi:hypothetical protein